MKVVYEYANRLQARGHEIEIVHPQRWLRSQPRQMVRRSYWTTRREARAFDGRPEWFDLSADVAVRAIPQLDPSYLPAADATFATGWQTALPVSRAMPASGHRFQLIQHFETWAGRRRLVERSWRLPLHKVVISRWLLQEAVRLGVQRDATYIPNGMDLDAFSVDAPPEERDPARLAMLAHTAKWKGTADGLAALHRAKERVPELTAALFSTTYVPKRLPSWIEFRGRLTSAELRVLYNESAIFLHPSHEEGWPLPPAESMACGCALVAADNPGVLEYASDGETAVVAPRRQPAALAEAIVRLAEDRQLRLRIAHAGAEAIGRFTWDNATDRLERLITSVVSGEPFPTGSETT